ncbi:hypothetical protein L596_016779 [Steinernema carpocapsae]|uniref:Peptidase C1A papain C-terminal domain-containing protein n=1 Tax=Steinernema carpocapsae TaxID=34508 RepID=A0A4U5NK27_STECR|nr:hypothetical protein L596_016779 [Steinernema carpocapsae]
MAPPKNYGSSEQLINVDFEDRKQQVKIRYLERALYAIKATIFVLIALILVVIVINVMSLYLIAKKTGELPKSGFNPQDRYEEYLRRFPEKGSKSRAAKNRFEIYKERMEWINKLNEDLTDGMEFEDNKFADWSEDEIKKMLLPLASNEDWLRELHLANHSYAPVYSRASNNGIDWRAKNAVGPVKNQQNCGSCWAFATTGLVESANAIAHKTSPVSLSEQELVDCDSAESGCDGGVVYYALGYVQREGLMTEASYPYKASQGQCQKNSYVSKIKQIYGIKQEEWAHESVLTNYGPFTVQVNVTKEFMYYKSGVFRPKNCTTESQGRHAMLVVGYGTTNDGVKYWIVKNSWGANWGTEGGYLHFIKGENACGIEQASIYGMA